MASKLASQAIETLSKNRREVLQFVQARGVKGTSVLLEDAARDLAKRIRQAEGLAGPGPNTFTSVQLRATLAQVRAVLRTVKTGIKDTIIESSTELAGSASAHTVDYLKKADRAFRGVGVQPLALNEARMFEQVTEGVRSSVLRRLASSGTPAAKATEVSKAHPAKLGILDRYGLETIKNFERTLQLGLVSRKSWAQMRNDLIAESPFLKGAPAHWATRIVRTECMGAYNRAQWEATREADDELEDMVKILSATFDDRTASDSYAVHGQIRRPEEAFEWWDGLYQHPPNRPNDREVVTPHRISWEIPEYLEQYEDEEVEDVWEREKHKGPCPPRPEMTTVPLEDFGKPQKKRKSESDGESREGDDEDKKDDAESSEEVAPEDAD